MNAKSDGLNGGLRVTVFAVIGYLLVSSWAAQADSRLDLLLRCSLRASGADAVAHGIESFLKPKDFVSEDWKLGQAMTFPTIRGWAPWKTRLSDFAQSVLINRAARAYVELRVFDPELGEFTVREYPVVKLSAHGNPVVLIHPRSHLLIPIQSRLERFAENARDRRSITDVSRGQPVPVRVYDGGDHDGGISELVLDGDGHHRAYFAWSRREPLHVELTSFTEYHPFSVTWETIQTDF